MLKIQINENSKQARLFAEFAKTLPFVKVIEAKKKKKESISGVKSNESNYNKDFIKKILSSRKSKGIPIKTIDLWK